MPGKKVAWKGRNANEGALPEGLPGVRSSSVVAILMSDLHFSLTPPLARSVEEDWLKVQYEYINQIWAIQHMISHDMGGPLPVVVAGDIFHKFSEPLEVVNHIMKWLPQPCYAVPGQHDLPNHSLPDIGKSAFWNLVEAGKIHYVKPGEGLVLEGWDIRLHGFPWSVPLRPFKADHHPGAGLYLEVAVCHQYLWMRGKGFPDAPKDKTVKHLYDTLKTYHACVFGDNHQGFLYEDEDVNVFNCGCFMRRKQDERGYRPMVGLLHSNGKILPHYLDVSQDRFLEKTEMERVEEDERNKEVIEALKEESDEPLDYEERVRRQAEEEKKGVGRIMVSSVEDHSKGPKNGR